MTQANHEAKNRRSRGITPSPGRPYPGRITSVAPLVPIVGAVAVGILLDRIIEPFGRSLETRIWAFLGLLFVGAAGLSLRWPRVSLAAFLAACVVLGAGWHHHRRFDLATDDLAWSISDAPQPVWIRGVIREALGLRGARPAPAADGQGNAGAVPERISTRFVIDITSVREGSEWRPASGRALTIVSGDRSDIRAGRAIDAAGSISRISPPLNPGEFDYRDHLRGDGIWLRFSIKDPASIRWGDAREDRWLFRWLGAVRDWSRDRLVGILDPAISPLATALLLGQREEIDEEVNDAFVRTGTTHLLAISGLHLQVLALAIGLALHVAGLSRSASAAGVVLAVIGYALLVGLSPSVVRSSAMTVTICLAVVFYRQSRALNNLAVAGLITLALNPTDLFDVGCQLSFLAIIALIWLLPQAQHLLEAGHRTIRDRLEGPPSHLDELERKYESAWRRGSRRFGIWIYTGLLTSAVVWLAAFPLVTLRFHLVSPIGIILNIPLILTTSGALLSSGIGLGLSALWQPLGIPCGWVTTRLLNLTTSVVQWGSDLSWGHWFLASPPWWWVCGFYALLCVAMIAALILRDRETDKTRSWYSWRRFLWLSLFLWILPGWSLAVVSDRPSQVEADLLAVGHGLAVVVQTPSGSSYLYDCGRMGDPSVGRRIIAPALWSRGISRLNSVILSHADDDHYNGLPDLFDRFGISEICVPPGFGGPENPGAVQLLEEIQERGIPIRTIASPDSWTVGKARFKLWHPPSGWDKSDATDNARSVVLEVEALGRRLILTGDLEQLGLVELVARPIDQTPIDVILSPHHGGKTANPEWLYSWAKPQAVLVSQRAPVPGTVDLLSRIEKKGTPIYRTWRDGAIRLAWQKSGITIERSVESPLPVSVTDPKSHEIAPVALASLIEIPRVSSTVMRWLVGILGLLLGLMAVAFSALIEISAWTLIVPPRPSARQGQSKDPASVLTGGTPISVIAADGSKLSGKWFPAEDGQHPRGTLLLLHGFGELPDQLGESRVPRLNREGWNVALPESRGYGESAGPYATFGANEAGDIRSWIDTIQARESAYREVGSRSLVIWGRSMGGAIATRAAVEDSRISALILESPMLDLKAALTLVLRRRHLPVASFLASQVLRRAGRLAGLRLDRPKLADVAPQVRCPVLIIQGTEDSLASIEEIRALAQRFPKPASVIEVQGAGHTDAMEVGRDDVWRRILAYLDAGK